MTTVARSIAETIENSLEEAEKYMSAFSQKMSEADKRINQIYHDIEFSPNVNAIEGFKLYKELRIALRYRRLVKAEHTSICELVKQLRRHSNFKRDVQNVHKNIRDYHENNLLSESKVNQWGADFPIIQEMARSFEGIKTDKRIDL